MKIINIILKAIILKTTQSSAVKLSRLGDKHSKFVQVLM